eukprot:CAMPEP_0119135830 /NCGR_PEP_ID=MMETSP1310-20130426/20153_1 /TAXON_ID=464262 /ORGANISM="Genus nov. species nov., Strain RCC2339" /LENGTH=356 /DNA_ID=CAMNT_0007126775 /DNA_START=153 /DNA_END=1219 /DNA_ORIENTATION=+
MEALKVSWSTPWATMASLLEGDPISKCGPPTSVSDDAALINLFALDAAALLVAKDSMQKVLTDNDDRVALSVILLPLLALFGTCYKDWTRGLRMRITRTEIPISAGLGSSAAFSVCIMTGLLAIRTVLSLNPNCLREGTASSFVSTLMQTDISAPLWRNENGRVFARQDVLGCINDWAGKLEDVIHCGASGVDNTVSSFGGAVRFEKADPSNPTLTKLQTCPALRLLVVFTKVPRNTKTLVGGVRERYNADPDTMGGYFERMGQIAGDFVSVSESKRPLEEQHTEVEKLVSDNQELLDLIGVNHEKIKEVVAIASEHGLKAKLTGAGGGGCVFILLHPTTSDSVVDAISNQVASAG